MSKRNALDSWWLWLIVLLAAAGAGSWWWQTRAATNPSQQPVKTSAPAPKLPAAELPAIRQPVLLIHPTVRVLQLFDGKKLVAEYPIAVDGAAMSPAHAVVNRKIADGPHGSFMLLTDQAAQPKVLAVIHAAPLPDAVSFPGVTMDKQKLRQLMNAIPVGAPATILP